MYRVCGLLVALLFNTASADTGLYSAKIRTMVPDGKDLVMSFEEISRAEKTSVAKVKFISGAALPSAMFIVKGSYEIARERGVAYFVKLREWREPDGASMYEIGFLNNSDENLPVYFDLKKSAEVAEFEVFSVSEFEKVFRNHE